LLGGFPISTKREIDLMCPEMMAGWEAEVQRLVLALASSNTSLVVPKIQFVADGG
jgi:hypothetical protein